MMYFFSSIIPFIFIYLIEDSISSSGTIPFVTSKWHKYNNKKNRKLDEIFSLRGGETSDSKQSSKIKGSCVGIDLGTTYR